MGIPFHLHCPKILLLSYFLLFHSYNHTSRWDSHHSLYPGYFFSQINPTFCHKQLPPNTAFIISSPAQECGYDSLFMVTSRCPHTLLACLPSPDLALILHSDFSRGPLIYLHWSSHSPLSIHIFAQAYIFFLLDVTRLLCRSQFCLSFSACSVEFSGMTVTHQYLLVN